MAILETRSGAVTVAASGGNESRIPIPTMDSVAIGIVTVVWAPANFIGDGAISLSTIEGGQPPDVESVLQDPAAMVLNGRQVQSFAVTLGGELLVASDSLFMRARNDGGSNAVIAVSIYFRRVPLPRMDWIALRHRQMEE